MVLATLRHFPETALDRALPVAPVHDLGEAVSGAIPPVGEEADDGRAERERSDLPSGAQSLATA